MMTILTQTEYELSEGVSVRAVAQVDVYIIMIIFGFM